MCWTSGPPGMSNTVMTSRKTTEIWQEKIGRNWNCLCHPLTLHISLQKHPVMCVSRLIVHRVSLPPTDVARRKIVSGDPSSKKQLSSKHSGHTLNPKQRTHRHELNICCAMTLTCESTASAQEVDPNDHFDIQSTAGKSHCHGFSCRLPALVSHHFDTQSTVQKRDTTWNHAR